MVIKERVHMKKLEKLIFFITVSIIIACLNTISFAAPVDGEIFGLENEYIDSSGNMVSHSIEVKIWGDEFYTHVETLDGYTLVRDLDNGAICYGIIREGGELVSTKVPYTGKNTFYERIIELQIRSGVKENSLVIKNKIQQSKNDLGIDESFYNYLPEIEISEANFLAEGNPYYNNNYRGSVTGLTLIIDFPDVKSSITPTQVDNFCNSLNYTEFSNRGSVRQYYRDISGGAIDYTNVVPTFYYTAKNNRSYYTDESIAQGTRARELIIEALQYLDNNNFNFSQLSVNASGQVRALNVFYAGARTNAWAKGLWPHASSLSFTTKGGTRFSRYQMTDMPTSITIGTFVHENGHLLFGWGDTYDTTSGSGGGPRKI